MDSKLRDSAGGRPGELKIYLLWRHALREAVFLASQRPAGQPVVLVRLVNQAVDSDRLQAACRQHGLRLVTLPMAFAGLDAHDRVLRDAVVDRLQQQGALPALASCAEAAVSS